MALWPSVVISANPNQRLSLDQGYEDTFHTAAGVHFKVTPDWLLKAGFAYDTSAVSDANRTLAFPVDRQFRYAVGAQWALTRDITLGTDFTLIDAGSAPITQGGSPLTGTLVGTIPETVIYALFGSGVSGGASHWVAASSLLLLLSFAAFLMVRRSRLACSIAEDLAAERAEEHTR